MKKTVLLLMIFCSSLLYAQETEAQPVYKQEGSLVAVTTYHDNGEIKEQGFYKNKKLHGEWNQYSKDGIKIARAHYRSGKKVGKWLFLNKGVLTEVTYQKNTIVTTHNWNNSRVNVIE